MCTRYYMELSPELRPYIEAANRSPLRDKMVIKLGRAFTTEGEVGPEAIAPVIATSQKGKLAAYPMVFGFPVKTGDKYMFQPHGSNAAWMCGLYRMDEDSFPYFVILTRDATEEIRLIHDRMPLILPASAVPLWINPGSKPAELLGLAVNDLVYEKA